MKYVILILSGLLVGSGCDMSDPNPVVFEGIEPIEIHELDVPEPSGLTLNTSNTRLYTVSDPGDNRVYKLDLEGTRLSVLSYHGDDLEGITYDDRDHTLWIVEERLRQVVHLDTLGNELSRHPIDFPGDINSGFEGICILPNGGFYVLNEMNPVAIIELDAQLNLVNSTEFSSALDLSGICLAGNNSDLILVSDESRLVMVLNEDLAIIHSTEIELNSFEGIDFDPVTGKLYIVNDGTTDMYIYDLEY